MLKNVYTRSSVISDMGTFSRPLDGVNRADARGILKMFVRKYKKQYVVTVHVNMLGKGQKTVKSLFMLSKILKKI